MYVKLTVNACSMCRFCIVCSLIVWNAMAQLSTESLYAFVAATSHFYLFRQFICTSIFHIALEWSVCVCVAVVVVCQ